MLDIPSWRDLSPIDNDEEIDGDRMESQGRSIPSTLHPCVPSLVPLFLDRHMIMQLVMTLMHFPVSGLHIFIVVNSSSRPIIL